MKAQPDLQFRRLEKGELELACGLVDSLREREPGILDGEAFGHEGGIADLGDCAAWGAFIRGDLIGAAWSLHGKDARAEIVCVAIAAGWWKMGLTGWVLEEVAKAARLAGAASVIVRLKSGGPALGEILADSGFSRPDSGDGESPLGVWVKGAAL